jgi:hypothetical protein
MYRTFSNDWRKTRNTCPDDRSSDRESPWCLSITMQECHPPIHHIQVTSTTGTTTTMTTNSLKIIVSIWSSMIITGRIPEHGIARCLLPRICVTEHVAGCRVACSTHGLYYIMHYWRSIRASLKHQRCSEGSCCLHIRYPYPELLGSQRNFAGMYVNTSTKVLKRILCQNSVFNFIITILLSNKHMINHEKDMHFTRKCRMLSRL